MRMHPNACVYVSYVSSRTQVQYYVGVPYPEFRRLILASESYREHEDHNRGSDNTMQNNYTVKREQRNCMDEDNP